MTHPNNYEIRERVAGANGKIAQYGMMVVRVEWGTAPLRTWVWKQTPHLSLGSKAQELAAFGAMRVWPTDIMVEEPHPDAFPSEVWAMRVLGVA